MNKNSWRDVTEAELAATGKVKRPTQRYGNVYDRAKQSYEGREEQALEGATLAPVRSKYRNVKTVGHDKKVYDSAKEARRAGDLALLEKSGAIRGLRSQVDFSCDVSRVTFPFTVHLGIWRADFVYKEKLPSGDWVDVAEDVKGIKTPLYKWKKRHVEAQHDIEIRET